MPGIVQHDRVLIKTVSPRGRMKMVIYDAYEANGKAISTDLRTLRMIHKLNRQAGFLPVAISPFQAARLMQISEKTFKESTERLSLVSWLWRWRDDPNVSYTYFAPTCGLRRLILAYRHNASVQNTIIITTLDSRTCIPSGYICFCRKCLDERLHSIAHEGEKNLSPPHDENVC